MPQSTERTFDQAPEPLARDDRLDSWKEIAAYLNRDVRTVQRWEKTAGLPVHRHAASRLRTAYALRSEINAWWRTQQQEPAAHAEIRSPRLRSIAGLSPRRAAAVLAVAAALTLAIGILKSHAPAGAGAPPESVAILVTPLEKSGADARLGAMLDETIARQLTALPRVEVVSPVRAARTLRLMRANADTPITATLGRELCLRDGGIAFLVAGNLRQLQSRYFVDLELVDPADGRVRRSIETQADTAGGLLAAVRQKSAQLGTDAVQLARERQASAELLQPVTTSSLAALRLYTAAVQSGDRGRWAASEALARRALAADERFASAHAWLGWSRRRQGRPIEECLPPLERAVKLSADVSEPENYVISGMFHDVGSNLLPAAAMYEAALRLRPRDRRIMDLLIDAYSRVGRFRDAVDLAVRRAELDPHDFYANVRAARAELVWHGDRTLAQRFIERAQAAATPAAATERPGWVAWLTLLPVFDRWLAGDAIGAVHVLAPLQATLDALIGRERDEFATAIGWSYLALGRVRDAELAFQAAATPAREINLAMHALALDDRASAREWLLQVREHSERRPALFAAVGLVSDAGSGLAEAPPFEHSEGMAAITRGLMAYRRREREEAVALLKRGTELLRLSGQPEYLMGAEMLARLSRRRGDRRRAEHLLESAARLRARTYAGAQWAGGAYWIRLNMRRLARYERAGRREEAARLRGLLQPIVAQADPDYPFARMLSPRSHRLVQSDGTTAPRFRPTAYR